MINFRYHIVSLMAVFLALAVGIALGVTLVSGEANRGLAAQAEQDRRQVQVYRQQLEQQRLLDRYRDSYATQVGGQVTANMLTGSFVAVVAMPDAPNSVVHSVQQAVKDSGGTLTATATVSGDVFDPAQTAKVRKAISPYSKRYPADATLPARVGTLLGRALLASHAGNADPTADAIANGLDGSVVSLDRSGTQTAELAIVVTAAASDPPVGGQILDRHVAFDLALHRPAAGVVIAGPNSTGVDGTDVAAVRSDPTSRQQLSSVDVADLPSGVSTVIMAGRELLNGDEPHHYGYNNSVDAAVPQLPIR